MNKGDFSMPMVERELYEFEGFRLDVGERIFTRKGKRIELTDRAFEVLCVLVRNAGRLVTKDEILSEVWPDAFVEENSINKNISLLRQRLGRGNFIETVRGRGFRFVAPVTHVEEAQSSVQIPADAEPVRRSSESVDAAHRFTLEREGNVIALREWRSKTDETVADSVEPPAVLRRPRRRAVIWIGAAITIVLAVAAGMFVSEGPQPSDPVRTIAVLPFKPLAPETTDAAFEIGIADTLISKLSASKKLIVRPLSAVRRYASVESDELAVGRELGVDAILSGSIQRSGDKIRANVRLIRVSDGAPIWSGTFDEKLTDIFILQDAISGKVVSALDVNLNVDEQAQLAKNYTTSPEAYELYLRGREQVFRIQPDALTKSIDFFEKAINADPNYALAYTGLSDAYRTQLIPALKSPHEVGPKAVANATRALELDESLPEAHISRGWLYLFYEWDWDRAEAEAKRAIELAPYNAEGYRLHAHVLSVVGRHDEAVEMGRKARELAPLTLITAALEGQFLSYAGRYDEARFRLERALESDPNFWVTLNSLGRVYSLEGRYDEAIEVLARIRGSGVGSPEPTGQLGHALAKAGRRDEAMRTLEELESARRSAYVPGYYLALVHSGLGDRENALASLEQSLAAREGQLIFIGIDKRWDWLRDDPRFRAIRQQMKL